MGIRNQQKEKRREQILAAGLELFIRKGYAATKISDIAQHISMSTGLLFHYFKSKENLLEELVTTAFSNAMSEFPTDSIEPLQFFENVANQIFDEIRNKTLASKMYVLMNQLLYSEATPQSIKDKVEDFDGITPSIKLIQKGQSAGTIREGDPHALAVAFWCAISSIAAEIARYPETPCPESVWIIDILKKK